MLGGRKVRSNKGKKRGNYKTRRTHNSIKISVGSNGNRKVSSRKVRSNKGKKRGAYGPRTGKTRSGKRFRGSGQTMADVRDKIFTPIYANPCQSILMGKPGYNAKSTPEICRSRMTQQWATTFENKRDDFNALDINIRGKYYNGTGIDLEKSTPVFTPAVACNELRDLSDPNMNAGCSTDTSLITQ
jgi:hypothetical protein